MKKFLTLVFAVALVACATPSALAQSAWDNVERVVVFGDIHGDYAKFEDQLRQAGLIDARGNWAGGRTHLVQLGDVPDRGDGTRRVLDHLMRLEPQARRAGGYVHALIGNHEAMMIEGDLRYTVPAEYAAFADRQSARRRDAFYARYVAALRAQPPAAGLPAFDAAFRAQFDAEHPLGWIEHRAAWSLTGTYGRWVAGHEAVIRINDTLYLHGGIGPQFVAYDADTLNNAIREALQGRPERTNGPHDVLGEAGPLWYRGLAQHDEAAETPHVQAVLAKYGVRRVVLGHTKRYSTVYPRFGGAVILTDIAVPSSYSDPHAFLIQEGAMLTTMHRGQRVSLRTSGPALCAYLGDIAAADPAGSPVAALQQQCLNPAPAAPAPASAR